MLNGETPPRFAIVVCPVYEDPEDQDASPFNLNNASPFSWSWLSTINRVNSQVQKVRSSCFIERTAFSHNYRIWVDPCLVIRDHPCPIQSVGRRFVVPGLFRTLHYTGGRLAAIRTSAHAGLVSASSPFSNASNDLVVDQPKYYCSANSCKKELFM